MSPRLAQWQQRGRSFRWRGHRMFFIEEGSGPAVLLLHGYPTGSFDWHAIWPMLVPHYRVIAPDFLGLGFSDKPLQHEYTLSSHAESVDGLLASLGLSAVHAVAHDLGVRVAQEMLARSETQQTAIRLKSLVLLNGAMCPEAYRPRPIQRLLASPIGPWLGPRIPRAAFDRAMRELFGPHTPPATELLDDFWSLIELGEGRRITHAVGRFWIPRLAMRDRVVGALQRSRVPIRVINGTADPNSGRHMVDRWLDLSPRTDVVRQHDIGHWPQIEDVQRTGRAILEFLTTQATQSSNQDASSASTPSCQSQAARSCSVTSLQPAP